jgi:phage head maturation protease/pterin-4a-carbinolamine dehydratase
MKIEYKNVDVVGVNEVKDEGDGIVTAYVSVTGVEDNVKDIIEPGAYNRTLNKRLPKGVWGHQWLQPTSKTLDVKELMPGDPDLPKELADGSPWPKEAGALRIKMQFNLGTPRGRDAYSDVKFFDKQQEWSIGYTVPEGGAYKDAKGVRHIKDLDLFEYSAVLFGANSHARTATSVKDIQLGAALMRGISTLEIKTLEEAANLARKDITADSTDADADAFEGDESPELISDDEDGDAEADEEVDDEELDEIEEIDDDEEEGTEEKLLNQLASTVSVKDLRTAYDVIGKVLGAAEDQDATPSIEIGYKALVEVKAVGYDSIADAVAAIDVTLDASDAKSMHEAAKKLDWALKANDNDAAQESANDLMDVLEKSMDDHADNDLSLKTVARVIADKTSGSEEDDEEDDDEYEGDEEDDVDPRKERTRKSLKYVAMNGIEYKSVAHAGRQFGMLAGGEDLDSMERKRAFVGTLPNDALLALEHVLDVEPGHVTEKMHVQDEIENRIYAGVLDEKMNMPASNGGGQDGRGGGRHRQAVEGRTPGPGQNFGETGATKKPTGKRLRKAVKGVKKPGRTTKTVNRVTGTGEPVKALRGESKEHFGTRRREELAKRGYAMPDGSFPITTKEHLKSAIRLAGNAKDSEAAKLHIKKRAKALGCADMIPDSWKMVHIDTTELKTLQEFVTGLNELS